MLFSMTRPAIGSLAILGSAAVLVGVATGAERLSVYRCSDSTGAVSLQDQPCPVLSEQTVRQIRRPIERKPAAGEPARPPDPAPAELQPPNAEPRRPPPPLWTCVDFDGQERESADGAGRGRYVPLWVVGRDPYAPRQLFGRVGEPLPQPSVRPATGPPTIVEQNTGSTPLVYVEERCYQMSAEQACLRYAEKRHEIERQIFNSQSSDRSVLQPQSAILGALLREHCGR